MEPKNSGCSGHSESDICEAVFELLMDYVDRELSHDEIRLVEEHLQMCPPCADEYRFEASVLKYMKGGFQNVEVPVDLVHRCLKAIEAEEL